MSIECDGPDCERHVRTASTRPASGLLTITGERRPLPEQVVPGSFLPDD